MKPLIILNPKHPFFQDLMSKEAKFAVEEFNKKEIELERKRCLCGKDSFSLIAEYDRYGIKQDIVICKNCGLVQSMPRPTENTYKEFYSKMWAVIYGKTDGLNDDFFYKKCRELSYPRFKFLDSNSIKSVLEIGTGAGWNLYSFHQAGKKTVGYDYDEAQVKFGSNKGLDLRLGSVDDVEDKFDLIILSHILEHFSDPILNIKKLCKHLTDSGMIYIEVPDISRFGIAQLQSVHTYYFSEKTLLHYMSKCNLFEISRRYTKGNLAILFKYDPHTFNHVDLTKEYNRMMTIIENYNSPIRRIKDLIIITLLRLRKGS